MKQNYRPILELLKSSNSILKRLLQYIVLILYLITMTVVILV
nr:MAG TPA: hypothetical protein [Caudoviricetes sp.]